MTPADVAENLMPKTEEGDAGTCLESLIQALEAVRVEEEAQGKEGRTQDEETESLSGSDGEDIESDGDSSNSG
jgi:hypothetical protein